MTKSESIQFTVMGPYTVHIVAPYLYVNGWLQGEVYLPADGAEGEVKRLIAEHGEDWVEHIPDAWKRENSGKEASAEEDTLDEEGDPSEGASPWD